jgi:hypothetical protein
MNRKITRFARGVKCGSFAAVGPAAAAASVVRPVRARYPKPHEASRRNCRRDRGERV